MFEAEAAVAAERVLGFLPLAAAFFARERVVGCLGLVVSACDCMCLLLFRELFCGCVSSPRVDHAAVNLLSRELSHQCLRAGHHLAN